MTSPRIDPARSVSLPEDRLPASIRFIERDWLSSNGVLFLGEGPTTLLDSGYHKHRGLTRAVTEALLGGRPLEQLMCTHLHSDHCGGNAELQRTWPCRTWIPQGCARAVRDWNESELSFRDTGQECERFTFDELLEDGQTLHLGGLQWQVIAAAGHDPDMLVLYCASHRLLISSDALWENGFGILFPELDGEPAIEAQRAILERISALTVDLVLPGHGPMFSDVAGALRRACSRLDHFARDPAGHARYAVKALVKFRLLERERIREQEAIDEVAQVPLLARANARHLRMSAPELGRWAIEALIQAGAARRDGDTIVNP
jgi:glyoxylase-like metal-dependent hydrolase (beta-lactamase superfamily II)